MQKIATIPKYLDKATDNKVKTSICMIGKLWVYITIINLNVANEPC